MMTKTGYDFTMWIYYHWEQGKGYRDFDTLRNAVDAFEKDIRKDQDKLTRHACAENVNNLGCAGIDDAHATIMNTKTIK